MDMLETALRQSFTWSLNRNRGSADSEVKIKEPRPISRDAVDCIEFVNLEAQNESQIRAFVTQFKIELNQLLELRCSGGNSMTVVSDTADDSLSDDHDSLAEARFQSATSRRVGPKRLVQPTIELNGKYSGVYNLSAQQSDEDEEDEDDGDDDASITTEEAYAKQMESMYGIPRDSVSAARFDTNPNNQVDDGYRSLSRNSVTSKRPYKLEPSDSIELRKQLNDIKSRVIDLVQELDQIVSPKLSEDQLEAYHRRRDSLISKLDTIIQSQKLQPQYVCDSSPRESMKSLKTRKIKSTGRFEDRLGSQIGTSGESSSMSDLYEEQVRVIDYDFDRRASDLVEMRRHMSNQHRSRPSIIRDSNSQTEYANQYVANDDVMTTVRKSAIINNEHNTTTQIDLSSSNRDKKILIDGPKTVDVEARKINKTIHKGNEVQSDEAVRPVAPNHQQSSGSMSTSSTVSSSFI